MNLPIMRYNRRAPYLVNKYRPARCTFARHGEKAARLAAAPLTCALDNLLGKTRSDGFNDDRDTRITRRNLTKEINADRYLQPPVAPTADRIIDFT